MLVLYISVVAAGLSHTHTPLTGKIGDPLLGCVYVHALWQKC